MRRRTTCIAILLTIALLFSQGLVAAYACTIGSAGIPQVSGSVNGAQTMPNCAGMDEKTPRPANLCEAHCLPSQPAQQADAPTAPVAPLPALVVQLPGPLVVSAIAPADVVLAAATPPPRLRFSRLLI